MGNTLRRDDGVALYTLELLEGVEKRAELQLYPELAADIAAFDRVIFIDADTGGDEPSLTVIGEPQHGAPLTHQSAADEIVRLAKQLYNFSGTAWLCRIPVRDFGYGEGLSVEARASALRAAELVRQVVGMKAPTNMGLC